MTDKASKYKFPPGALVGNTYDLFFFSIVDFSYLRQRPQQLAYHFAKRGHRVFYLSISQFLPADSGEDFEIKEIKKNIYEVFLKSPSFLRVYEDYIDSKVLEILYRSLNGLRKKWGLITTVSLVHNPFWSPLVYRMREEHGWKIIYDCMDEWDTFKGVGRPFLDQENILVRNADLVLVTAGLLYEKWSKQARRCILVRNACDYEHFARISPNTLLADVRKPIIGFFGGIAEWVDIDLIRYAARRRTDWSFVLLGEVFTDVSALKKMDNVHLLGRWPYEEMPSYLFHFDVCIIPFKKNKVTEAADPVKLYEFLSSGKPIVARDLNEIRQYEDLLYLFDTEEGFVQRIEKALNEKDARIREKRRHTAASNTWDDRIDRIDHEIQEIYKKASIVIANVSREGLEEKLRQKDISLEEQQRELARLYAIEKGLFWKMAKKLMDLTNQCIFPPDTRRGRLAFRIVNRIKRNPYKLNKKKERREKHSC